MRAQLSTLPHVCVLTHLCAHIVKYEKEGRNQRAVRRSGCPGRRGLTVVASFQPQRFNAMLISGVLDIPDHSLLISSDWHFQHKCLFSVGELVPQGKKKKKDPISQLDTDFYSPIN